MHRFLIHRPDYAYMEVPFLEHPIMTDTVFYTERITIEEVRNSLINHDGYPDDIIVTRMRDGEN